MAKKPVNQPQTKQISVELTGEKAEGTYANLAIVSHSDSEFVMDFARLLPGLPKAIVQSRIIMTPNHTKMLLMALKDNIQKYEARNGEIKMPGAQKQGGPLSDFFGGEPSVN